MPEAVTLVMTGAGARVRERARAKGRAGPTTTKILTTRRAIDAAGIRMLLYNLQKRS